MRLLVTVATMTQSIKAWELQIIQNHVMEHLELNFTGMSWCSL